MIAPYLEALKDLGPRPLAGIAIATLFLYRLYSQVLYPFLFSPVRHIPGPYFSRISKLPLQWAIFKKRRAMYASNLLDTYGPVVVIAPDQVHTNDDAAMKTIYDKSSLKTSFYANMGSWKGITSTLGFRDYRSAAPSRNNLIQCFQNRNLSVLVENIESHINEFITLISKGAATGTPVDGVVVFRYLALDIVTDVLWGETDTLLASKSRDDSSDPIFLRRFHAFSNWNALKSFMPAADLLVRLFGTKQWKQLRQDCGDMDVTSKDALKRWEENKEKQNRDKDVLSMLQSMNSAAAPAVSPNDIPAYMVEMLAAGSSTTSHTAAFACYLLARNLDAQACLRKELFEQYPDPEVIEVTEMMALPFLDGVIRETMRLYPMIPGPLERHLGKEIVVDGKVIPAGVIASTAAIDQGRLEEVFPDNEKWKPERWIDATDRMKLNWTPFGHGCRACPGSNLALTELKYMIGKIFRLYKSVVPKGHDEDDLQLADIFAAGSRSGHVWLQFEDSRAKVI
ncbi:cytochrome P450 [Sarocladium strictum]